MRLAKLPLALLLSLAFPAGAAAAPPVIGPVWTSSVSTVSATLRAEITANGLQTGYRFQHISEAAFAANLSQGKDGFSGAALLPPGPEPTIGAGTEPVEVAAPVAALAPDTPYRFRVLAGNEDGPDASEALLFYTEPFAGASPLLPGRAWELVSPPDKEGGQVQGPGESLGGGTIQAAAGGGALTFSSTFSFGAAEGAPPASQYLSRREGSGWVTENVSAATVAGAYGPEPDGVPFQLFSPQLTRAVMLEGGGCEGPLGCLRSYSLRTDAGAALAALAASPEAADLDLAGAGPDLTVAVLSTCEALTGDATEVPGSGGCDPAHPNLYLWSSGSPLHLLNLLPGDPEGTPGATLAAPAGAVSSGGDRVYFTLDGDLYLREGEQTVQLDAGLGGGGQFETASREGSLAFFSRAGHLYRYRAPSGALEDLTPAGGLLGVFGASAEGSRVYYQTTAGIFAREGEAITQISAGAATPESFPPATGTARVTPSGSHLAFISTESLSGYDNRDAESGLPRSEAFLYEAAADRLLCVSCNQTGERPLGDSTMPPARANGLSPSATRAYKPRSLSEDGRHVFFDSTDALAIQDTAGRPDVYEWAAQGVSGCARAGGCLGLISRGRSSEGGAFLDASADGADAYFLTEDSLVGADTGFADVYDARQGGGLPDPPRPIECAGDACQFLPSEPEDPQPGTLVPGAGNPPLRFERSQPRCRARFVRRARRCVSKRALARRACARRARKGKQGRRAMRRCVAAKMRWLR